MSAVAEVESLDVKPEYRAAILQVILQKMLGTSFPPPNQGARKIVAAKVESRGLLPDRIGELISGSFFKETRTLKEVKQELKNRGFHHDAPAIGMALLSLVRKKALRRIFEAKDGKKQYLYINP